MSTNPPSPSADRARVEAVRATLLAIAEGSEADAALCEHLWGDGTAHAQEAAALREAATWAPPGDEGLRAAAQELVDSAFKGPHYCGVSPNALHDLRAALAAVSPLPQKEQRDER